jgi:jumonji domain-containing protein 2
MISPKYLKEKLTVNEIIQNQGEIIITFPGGYHAGFNYGFNIAEATNYASPKWVKIGEKTQICECAEHGKGQVKINITLTTHKLH